jgi:hypothetical protein
MLRRLDLSGIFDHPDGMNSCIEESVSKESSTSTSSLSTLRTPLGPKLPDL